MLQYAAACCSTVGAEVGGNSKMSPSQSRGQKCCYGGDQEAPDTGWGKSTRKCLLRAETSDLKTTSDPDPAPLIVRYRPCLTLVLPAHL